jgi:hypothetical protein
MYSMTLRIALLSLGMMSSSSNIVKACDPGDGHGEHATHCGSERPATVRSDALPCFTLRAASSPTARNAAR